MKKAVKRSLTVIIIAAVLLAAFIAVFMYRFNSETKKMSTLATGQAAKGIYAIKDAYANMYLIKAGDEFIAVDAANDMRIVSREMKKTGLDPNKVKAVFLTHSDDDHVGALPLFKNAVVYISKNEEQMINGKTVRMLLFHNKAIKAYKTLADGQAIEIGPVSVKCIFTPGHTPGSACYLIDNAYLFTGDTLSLKDGHAEQFNELFNMDSKEEVKSFAKIIDLPGTKYIFTAHYGATDNYQKAFEKMRK